MTVNWFKVQVYMGYILSSYKILMVEPPMTNSEAPSEVPSSLGSRGNGGKAPLHLYQYIYIYLYLDL